MQDKIDLHKLPPLKALKGFEAATRHQSIREAADELFLTHPAVSHQVRLIEEELGVDLFTQEGRHIVSTEEGRVLYPYVRAAFETLLEGVESVHRNALDKPLRVHTYVTASIRWLARRVPQFMASHPDIKLHLSTCGADWKYDDAHADVGIVYCESVPDQHFHWVPLFEYALFPVCNPQVAAKLGAASVGDLLRVPLVHVTTEEQGWQAWFASAGVAYQPLAPHLSVDTEAMALEMALTEDIVVLVNGPFANEDLAAGRLVSPVNHRLVCRGNWGLICRRNLRENPRIRTFIDWVTQLVAEEQQRDELVETL